MTLVPAPLRTLVHPYRQKKNSDVVFLKKIMTPGVRACPARAFNDKALVCPRSCPGPCGTARSSGPGHHQQYHKANQRRGNEYPF
jgi:hypothetical protein